MRRTLELIHSTNETDETNHIGMKPGSGCFIEFERKWPFMRPSLDLAKVKQKIPKKAMRIQYYQVRLCLSQEFNCTRPTACWYKNISGRTLLRYIIK